MKIFKFVGSIVITALLVFLGELAYLQFFDHVRLPIFKHGIISWAFDINYESLLFFSETCPVFFYQVFNGKVVQSDLPIIILMFLPWLFLIFWLFWSVLWVCKEKRIFLILANLFLGTWIFGVFFFGYIISQME